MRHAIAFVLLLLAMNCTRNVVKDNAMRSAEVDQIESHLFNGLLLMKANGNLVFSNLAERMQASHVAGVSYALIKDNKTYATRALGKSHKPSVDLTSDILMSAASISKTATGLLFARLHELKKIDLDKSINDYFKEYKIDFRLRAGIKISEQDLISAKYGVSKKKAKEVFKTLKKYQTITEDNYLSFGHPPKEHMPLELLPYYDLLIDTNTALRKRATPSIEVERSLRQILSHSAGISVGGLSAYYIDEAPRKIELLRGIEKGRLPVIEVVHLPYEGELESITAKTKFNYSGGGYILIEILLEEMFKQSFEEIAERYVFSPLGMRKTTFEQTSTDNVMVNGIRYRKAQGYDEKGESTDYGIKIFPAKSMAGMWTTASDCALMAIALNNSLNGVPGSFLSQKMAREVIAGMGEKAGDRVAGLGVFFNENGISHPGFNPGFISYFVLNRDGHGFVRMINSDNGFGIGEELLHATNFVRGDKFTTAHIEAQPRDLAGLQGIYVKDNFSIDIKLINNQLVGTLNQKGRTTPIQGSSFPLVPILGGRFATNTVLPFPTYFKFSQGQLHVEHKNWIDIDGIYRKSL